MAKYMPGDERKQQFIEIAFRLFNQKGYEDTSVQDILDEIGLARGTFYYYFDSKEDILEELTTLMMDKIAEIPRGIVAREDLTALEKLNKYFKDVVLFKQARMDKFIPMVEGIYGEKNTKLEMKLYQQSEKMIKPLIRSIIDQGIAEGSFQIDYPEEAASFYFKLFFLYGQEIGQIFSQAMASDEDVSELKREIIDKYRFLEQLIASTFGIETEDLILAELAEESIEDILGGNF
ncbi:MAG: TetR/AcrR family transcriptional regulator [Bacillota bacterium]